MKVILTLTILLINIFSFKIQAQDFGGEYTVQKNSASHPCLTAEQYKSIEKEIKDNIKALGLNDKMQKTSTSSPTFSWPLKMANGLHDSGYYFIGNYVDQDTAKGKIKDYYCDSVTYDGHRGTDIAITPFPFYKMDNNQVAIIAAASGTILVKVDGNFDKNCAMNNLTPNYIAIKHSDGSIALYFHMKKYSLTTKKVGDTVQTGDFLGYVGSSGSSTAPHLHFEVWANSNASSLLDPYSGKCNKLNSSSWWNTQMAHSDPNIITIDIDSAVPILPACPATETPNEDTCYIPGTKAVLAIFLRDETKGLTAIGKILNPDGSIFYTWTHNSIKNYLSSYWYRFVTIPTKAGKYTFETSYNSNICRKTFTIGCTITGTDVPLIESDFRIAPNPTNNSINIVGKGIENGNCLIRLKNIMGKTMLMENVKIENNLIQKELSLTSYPQGIYFLSIETEKSKTIRKIIKVN